MIMTLKNTGKTLASIRKERGMTQSELAKRLGVHSQYISNFERSTCMPPKSSLKKLKKVLALTKIERECLSLAMEVDAAELVREEFRDLIS